MALLCNRKHNGLFLEIAIISSSVIVAKYVSRVKQETLLGSILLPSN